MMNSVNLTGRLTKDPELMYTPNGVAVCNFTLAVNRSFLNQNGDRDVDFIQIVAFKGTAESVANYLYKGSLVGVEGRLQSRTYENQEGKTVWVTEVIANNVHFLEPKKDDQQGQPAPNNSKKQYNNKKQYGGRK